MTPRSIRRAAERRANKLARKQAAHQAHPTALPEPAAATEDAFEDTPEATKDAAETGSVANPISPARRAANQANARLSSGPRTPAGKQKSSLNAVKTALTGRTVLLPSDDADEYQRRCSAFEREFQPVGPQESALVQSIADSFWRCNRIFALEMTLFAQGQSEFADLFPDAAPAQRPGLIELHTFLTYEKQLRNLQLQEARLDRRRDKELAELRRLQQERKDKEKSALELAAQLYLAAQKDHQPFEPAAHGFDFSSAEIERHLARVRAAATVKSAPLAS